jgi:hypothetical protein
MSSFLHNLTHSHILVSKPGVGEFAVCGWRRPFPRCRVVFRPALSDSAGWHPVPAGDALPSMLAASTPYEAMAILRAAAGE